MIECSARHVMKRAVHPMIFLLFFGIYAPLVLVVLPADAGRAASSHSCFGEIHGTPLIMICTAAPHSISVSLDLFLV
ncbi:hypothetical protein NLL52_28240, partial [Klebsiella pneumoniae]|nr:hypothetical protein [Klebsiella pneumoniae]